MKSHNSVPTPQKKELTVSAQLKQIHHLLNRALSDRQIAGKTKPKPRPMVRSDQSPQQLARQVKSLTQKLIQRHQELNHKYLSHLASFENYKQQLADEQAEMMKYRASGIAQHLLPALDSFEIALAEKQSNPLIQNYLEGFQMIYQLIADAFAKEGIKIIPTQTGDRFDHRIHNAATTEHQSGVEPHRILKVVKKGYRLSDRVLRHSVVVVSAPPPPPTAKPKKQNQKKELN